jgi:hypothetical protein
MDEEATPERGGADRRGTYPRKGRGRQASYLPKEGAGVGTDRPGTYPRKRRGRQVWCLPKEMAGRQAWYLPKEGRARQAWYLPKEGAGQTGVVPTQGRGGADRRGTYPKKG